MARLRGLIDGVEHRLLRGSGEVDIRAVEHDSRRVSPGACFVCLRGSRFDGHAFAGEAAGRGAAAVVLEEEMPLPPGPAIVQVKDTRAALAALARAFHGDPARRLTVLGVTGTNGKTTTTYLLEAILAAAGRTVGVIGTIDYRCGALRVPAERTTPEAPDLQALLRRMLEVGATHVTMEVSSHSLALHRVDGVEFDAAVFTNLTQDHLDFHGSFEAYLEAKTRLFRGLGVGAVKRGPKAALLNADDPHAERIRAETTAPVLTYALEAGADLTAEGVSLEATGLRATLRTPWGPIPVRSALLGRHNMANILGAAGAALAVGAPPGAVTAALATLRGVPGRLEQIEAGQPFTVAVDYAHTPDALERVLRAARALTAGRLLCVFGCGGDRDRGKRPLMGEAAARLADHVILTSDNPRSEEPEAILNAIEEGVRRVPGADGRYAKIVNRAEAIAAALAAARRGDFVLIAGKGHETYQILGTRTIPFDDRDVARQTLADLGFGTARPV
ncbi:MAG TPA: UDP-N-acetylmuramoyl-L-alanyl-D-glutamate--2,6-diaminopimelate ligase [Candidatus Methylomirabilis sp.]|nr:UDP-N-acetylmuramoyl-L-alanyl-D-glutamate--2,6-diaminopimelate ligase [Candidatus Methylomirabilis sp.]